MRRRSGRRQQGPSTPTAVGSALRETRESSSVTLAEVHDRTGIRSHLLEALESGNLTPFPDQRGAVTAVRRYADLMGLDADQFEQVVQDSWGRPEAGFPDTAVPAHGPRRRGRRRRTDAADDAAVLTAGHLSRYPGDGTHLRAFTQTDQVPGVRRVDFGTTTADALGQFTVTGVFPATPGWVPPVRRAPWILRAAVWCVAALLVVAGGGLAVHHWEPKWLVDIHVVRPTSKATTPTTALAGGTTPTVPDRDRIVTQTSANSNSATISVRAATYTVEVAASGACWVKATTPQSFGPVFSQTLQSGQSTTLSSSDGQLTVNLGSSYALVAVKIDGKVAPGWLFKPAAAPFILNFTSTTS